MCDMHIKMPDKCKYVKQLIDVAGESLCEKRLGKASPETLCTLAKFCKPPHVVNSGGDTLCRVSRIGRQTRKDAKARNAIRSKENR